MPSELQKLAMAVLARRQDAKRDTAWDSRGTVAAQVSQGVKVAGTAKTHINQADNTTVPLSQALRDGTLGQSANSGTPSGTVVGQHYRDAVSTLLAQCPDHVPEERWRQAVEDGRQFLAVWGAQAQAFGWAARELFGLHPVPERPAANYSRLSRLDCTGLIWLLRGRPVIALTAMEAVMRCHSGAGGGHALPQRSWRRSCAARLTYRRRTEQALAGTANGAPATETGNVMQPTGGVMQPTLPIAKGAAA